MSSKHRFSRDFLAVSLSVLLSGTALAAVPEAIAQVEPDAVREFEFLVRAANVDVDGTNPERARTKLLDFVVQRLVEVELPNSKPVDGARILARDGLLPPSSYEVSIASQALGVMVKDRGFTKVDVNRAVRDAVAVQHLAPPSKSDAEPEKDLVSLFVCLLNPVVAAHAPQKAVWDLVLATRQTGRLDVFAFYRVYRDDLDADVELDTPLDLFKAFIDRFGVQLTAMGRPTEEKLIEHRVFPHLLDQIVGFTQSDPGRATTMQAFIRKTSEHTVEVAMAFAVDETAIDESLGRHKDLFG